MKKIGRIVVLMLALAVLLTACGGKNGDGTGDADRDVQNGDAGKVDNDAGEPEAGKDTEEDSGKDEYPALELPDISGVALTEAEYGGIRFSYPEDKWTLRESSPVALMYNETIDADSSVNMNLNDNGPYGELTDDDLESVKSAQTESLGFMKVNAAEFRSVDGNKVMYLDFDIEDNDAYVDFIIENAGLSEEVLESVGGREGLLELMPPTKSLMFYFVKDGELYSLSGIYFEDRQRDDLMELVAALYPSIEKA